MPWHFAALRGAGQLFSERRLGEALTAIDRLLKAKFLRHNKQQLVGETVSWDAWSAMPVKVKICGITNAQDALGAVEAGADLLGFVFCESSPRFIQVSAAAAIIRQLPPFIVKAGVFVNASEEAVMQAARECSLNLLQFHGEETPEFCVSFGLMSMKAFRVKGRETLQDLPKYQTDAWLLDAYTPGKTGGTGERFDWALAAEARVFGRPVFLAGGLTPENVAAAIEQARPYGVDVSSGVESAPGKKDLSRVRAFIDAAKKAGV